MGRINAAAIVGVAATLTALGAQLAGVDALDARAWARWRRPAPASGSILVVEPEGDARAVGTPVDHATLARVLGRLSRAGAAAIALDLPLIDAPARGGAAAEALLRLAISQAGRVVLPITLEAAPAQPGPLTHSSWIPTSASAP
jgi:CHASE2 domain-containing sensor protein